MNAAILARAVEPEMYQMIKKDEAPLVTPEMEVTKAPLTTSHSDGDRLGPPSTSASVEPVAAASSSKLNPWVCGEDGTTSRAIVAGDGEQMPPESSGYVELQIIEARNLL